MIDTDNSRILSDAEKSQYKFDFCEFCKFYECELVGEYKEFRDNHPSICEAKELLPTVPAVAELLNIDSNFEINTRVIDVKVIDNESDNYSHIGNTVSSNKDILSYDQSERKDGCFMSHRQVHQIECGRQRVAEGIGDHFKIETNNDGTIKEGIANRWEPLQPVFISAQTGQGKNYFIENTLIPYVEDLNYKNITEQRVLILSNRRALKLQIEDRLKGNDSDDEDGKIYSNGVVDVMTYQSILSQEKNLEKKQKKVRSRYLFVICDEAHFFTSDAMFNPHTQKILLAIVRLFQDAVRIYMSATPYECLEYIIKYEEQYKDLYVNFRKPQHKWKGERMVFYHFKRDYSYFDVKTYSLLDELYGKIVESVNQRKEKWLIFIDDKERCKTVKAKLEEFAKDMECPLIVEKKNTKKGVEEVFAVDADSKKNPTYQEIVNKEKLNEDTYVLISTSVLDNGVNLTGINNIVVSDMSKVKCLQMAGRARVSGIDDRKVLYVKRFGVNDVKKQMASLRKRRYAYHNYELAYGEPRNPLQSRGYSEYQFLDKYYNEDDEDWKDAKHWFGRPVDNPTELYLNEIAKSLVDNKLILQYQFIYDEMIEESSKEGTLKGTGGIVHTGQKYLEYQLSWFGKEYREDDDITFADKEKAKKEFIAFLESYAESGKHIVERSNDAPFRAKFTSLQDAAYGRKETNKGRNYDIGKMNRLLKENNIGYKVITHSSYWVVEIYNWEDEDSE